MTGGNMYEWISYTWNPMAGECPHQCEYCYVKALAKRYKNIRQKYSGELRIDEKALNQRLPSGKVIFVCSMNDLFAAEVDESLILRILRKTKEYEGKSQFLFQTKNPSRFLDFVDLFPRHSIFATTIESNRPLVKTRAPPPKQRMEDYIKFKRTMQGMDSTHTYEITIEPILDFDPDILIYWINEIRPNFVSIGADSKKNNLPEPSEQKIIKLVRHLYTSGIGVHLKKNLKRLAPSAFQEVSMWQRTNIKE